MEQFMRVVGLMNGKLTFQKHSDGTVDRGRMIWFLCKKELAYHRSGSSLAYHINAKHPLMIATTVSISNISNLAIQEKLFPKLHWRRTAYEQVCDRQADWRSCQVDRDELQEVNKVKDEVYQVL